MGLFKNLLARPLEALDPVPTVPLPEQMGKIPAATADEIVLACKPQGLAEQAFNPEQTPTEYLAALQEDFLGEDMIKTLAHGMPDREGIGWAAQSAQKVSDKLPPADVEALKAAETWLKDPSELNKAAAAQAASKAGLQGPGSLAAEAVALSRPPGPAKADSARPAKSRLAPEFVAGAVLMSAAIAANPDIAPKEKPADPANRTANHRASNDVVAAPPGGPPPEVPEKVRRHLFRTQQPFIADGVAIASGKTPV